MMDAKLKSVVRFILENNIRLTETGTNEWKFQSQGQVHGLDTTRAYTSFDEAIEALVPVAARAYGAAA